MFSKWLDWALRRVFGTPVDGTGQKLTVSDAAAISSALTKGATIRLCTTTDCWVMFCDDSGDDATNDGTDMLLAAWTPEVFTVDDTNIYVSCLKYNTGDSDGVLSIMPLAGYRVPGD